jgi:hypothetical protein
LLFDKSKNSRFSGRSYKLRVPNNELFLQFKYFKLIGRFLLIICPVKELFAKSSKINSDGKVEKENYPFIILSLITNFYKFFGKLLVLKLYCDYDKSLSNKINDVKLGGNAVKLS